MMKARSPKTNKLRTTDRVTIKLDNGGMIVISEESTNRGRIRISCDGGSLLYMVPVVSNVAEIGCVDIVTKKRRKNK